MSEVNKVINEYKKSMVTTKRTRYPKLALHPKFEQNLDVQIGLLRKEGLTDKQIIDRLQRAIPFHVYGEEN